MLVHTISIFTATGDYYALLFVYLQPVIPLVVCRHRLCYLEHMSNHPMFDFTFYNLADTMSHVHMVGMCTQQRFWKRFEVCKVIRKEHLQINYSGNNQSWCCFQQSNMLKVALQQKINSYTLFIAIYVSIDTVALISTDLKQLIFSCMPRS